MEPSCVRQDLIPGATRLFADYLYRFSEVAQFYPAGQPTTEQVVHQAQNLNFPEDRRSSIVSALRLQNENASALDKLAKTGTVAVLSGQQVGLFSGPAYTIFKALTAVKLADHLESQGIPAVPVFWLATEDHDLAEVDHVWIFDDKGVPSKLSCSVAGHSGGPVGSSTIADLPLAELRTALGSLPFADGVIAALSTAYHPGATLGAAFANYLKNLLSSFGLLFLDPLHPAIRELAAPFLLESAAKAPQLVPRLLQRTSELESAGYHAQVLVAKDASLLFLLNGNKRVALRLSEGKFTSREGDLSLEQLSQLGSRLSPNALLRPVLQDYLLPTVAYVAGPAEVSYFAQSSVLYESLLGRMPVIFPRNSFTFLDPRAEKLMTANGLRLTDVLDNRDQVTEKIALRLIPRNLNDRFDQLQASVSADLSLLQSSLISFDPTLKSAAEKSTAKMLYQLGKLQRKTAREILRRDEKAAGDADHLINLVYPNKRLQERIYSIVPFLARYGPDLPQIIYSHVQLNCSDHMLRTF